MKKIRTIYLIALCAAMILGVFFSIKQKEKLRNYQDMNWQRKRMLTN